MVVKYDGVSFQVRRGKNEKSATINQGFAVPHPTERCGDCDGILWYVCEVPVARAHTFGARLVAPLAMRSKYLVPGCAG